MKVTSARGMAEAKQEWVKWQAWIKENDSLIIASGIPSETIRSHSYWEEFLDMAFSYPVDFNHNRLSLSQKISLLRLISTRPIDLRRPVAVSLINDILNALEPRI